MGKHALEHGALLVEPVAGHPGVQHLDGDAGVPLHDHRLQLPRKRLVLLNTPAERVRVAEDEDSQTGLAPEIDRGVP
jgi:hypothetical protein